MSTDFERRLRSEMGRVTVRPRPGLVQAAYHRYRSRRRAARAAAITGTAAVVAAGSVIAAGVTGTSTPPARSTAAVLLSHVSSALASTNTIAYSYTVVQVASRSAPGERIASWDYGGYYGSQRVMTYTSTGQPYSDRASVTSPGQQHSAPGELTILNVDYPAKTAATEHFTIPSLATKETPRKNLGKVEDVPVCGQQGIFDFSLRGIGAGSVASCMRELLTSKTATIVGRQWIGGIDTIKIELMSRISPQSSPWWRQTLWVNPSDYLPVQITTLPYSSDRSSYMNYSPLTIGPLIQAVTDFQWLSPTAANLAQLNAPIPSSFHVSG